MPGGQTIQAADDEVTPGFFDSIGLPLIAGRDFTAADQPGSPWVAIVNEALAGALFKNENPIGRTIQAQGDSPRRFQVVGVVGNSHYYDLRSAPPPAVYFTYQEDAPYMPTLHVRTTALDTAGTIAAVRHEFDVLDKGFPVFNIKTLELRIEDSMARERMVADLSAAVGLYGVLALPGLSAYAGNRHPDGVGREYRLGGLADRTRSAAIDRRRKHRRNSHSDFGWPTPEHLPFRRVARGSADAVRRGCHNADSGCNRGERSGSPRRSDRPDGRPAL